MNVGQAMNRLCHTSLRIKGHVLAPTREKLKEKWADFRSGCIQVLSLHHQESLCLSVLLFCAGTSSPDPEVVPSNSRPMFSKVEV